MYKLILICIIGISCNSGIYPVYVPYFKKGQIIRDEITGQSILKVIDAVKLNKAIGRWEQGFVDYNEYQIDSVFKKYCQIIK